MAAEILHQVDQGVDHFSPLVAFMETWDHLAEYLPTWALRTWSYLAY